MEDRIERTVEAIHLRTGDERWSILIDEHGTPFHLAKNGVFWHDIESEAVQTVMRLLLDRMEGQ